MPWQFYQLTFDVDIDVNIDIQVHWSNTWIIYIDGFSACSLLPCKYGECDSDLHVCKWVPYYFNQWTGNNSFRCIISSIR